MIYSAPYIAIITVFLICGGLAWNYRNNRTLQYTLIGVCAGLLVLFFGLRGFCFYDWNVYYPLYESKHWGNLLAPYSGQSANLGFNLLMVVCKSIFDNYFFFQFVLTVINTYLLIRFLKKKVDNIPLTLAFVVCMGGLYIYTDLMRNGIAILLFVNALEFIEKRRMLPYFLICLLALSFHKSSLLFFPLYFFLHRKINKWVYISVFIAGNVILLFKIPVFLNLVSLFAGFISKDLQRHINGYTILMNQVGFVISIGYLERLLTGVLVFIYMDRIRQLRADANIFINSMLLYFFMFFFFSEFKTLSSRLSVLFCYSYWIIWPTLIRSFVYQGNRLLFIAFLTVYCLLKINGSTNTPVAKYENVLFKHQPYHLRQIYFRKHFNEAKE